MHRKAIVVIFLVAANALAQNVVTAPRVRYATQNAGYNFLLPIKVRVRANDVRSLENVQVRIFPNRTLVSVQTTPLGMTSAGCYILKSRVEPYAPSFLEPDILLREIYDVDFRCSQGVLAPTPYVLVIESAGFESDRFLRINPSQIPRYFRNAYAFTVTPPRRQPCGNPSQPRPMVPVRPATNSASSREERQVVDMDARVESCITAVRQ